MDFLKRYSEQVRWGVFVVLTAGAALVWVAVYAQKPPGVLTVAVLNVGQGDAIYIETPSGTQALIDGGPDTAVLRELSAMMPLFDRSLDVLLESHPHKDHIEGLIDVLKRYSVRAFVEPGVAYGGEAVELLEEEIDAQHAARYVARRGMVVDLGGGVQMEILYPDHDVTNLREVQVHEGNMVARLTYGKMSVLLMGDAPKDVEDRLVQADGAKLTSDILKVGHHGSRTSSGEVFAALVRPQFAAISVGAGNMYHLPNTETIATFKNLGADVLRTDEAGRIIFCSDGTNVWKAERSCR